MGKIRENLSTFLSLMAILLIGIPLTTSELRRHKAEKQEQRKQWDIEDKVEYFREPMKKNSSSFQIGYQLKDSHAYGEDVITYFVSKPKDEGMRMFDSLFVEICKHHCDSVVAYKFNSLYNREFECYNAGQFLKLKYKARASSEHATISLEYGIPQIQGLHEEWEYCIVNGKYPTRR